MGIAGITSKRCGSIIVCACGAALLLGLAGCGSSTKTGGTQDTTAATSEAASSVAASTTAATTSEETYQSILDEYTAKLQEATPGLIDEYQNEAASNTDGVSGLAKISNDKISKLAEISTEGTEKMAQLMYSSGSGSYSEYQEWATKLTDVYTTEAQKITDAYMASAM